MPGKLFFGAWACQGEDPEAKAVKIPSA